MKELDELYEEKQSWDDFFTRVTKTRENTLAALISIRKEIASLHKQKLNFPDSVSIEERLKEYDDLLNRSTDIIMDIDTRLQLFHEKSRKIDQMIAESNDDTEGSSVKP